ncbi:TPA: hypothetical protein DCX15_02460 [bacterium]|nr:hypothetical protein [bacterium]
MRIEPKDVLCQNLAVLTANYPKLAEKLNIAQDGEGATLVKTDSGDYTCVVDLPEGKKVFLHSRRNPQNEAVRLIDKFDFLATRVWILLGLGLGYHLFELIKRVDPLPQMLVIEKNIDVFKRSLTVFDWQGILKRKEIELFIGEEKEEIERRIREKYFSRMLEVGTQVIKHEPSVKLLPHYYLILSKYEMRRVDIGCGYNPKDGYIGVDKSSNVGADVVCDLEHEELPFKDSTIEEVYSYQCLEHIGNLTHALREIHRICKPGAKVHISTPYATDILHISNPHHVTNFTEHTFDFYTGKYGQESDYGIDFRFKVLDMGFYYHKEFENKPPEEQKWAREHLLNVVWKIDYNLEVVK